MLKEFMWSAFEKTGNIDPYILYKELEAKNTFNDKKLAEEEAATSAGQ